MVRSLGRLLQMLGDLFCWLQETLSMGLPQTLGPPLAAGLVMLFGCGVPDQRLEGVRPGQTMNEVRHRTGVPDAVLDSAEAPSVAQCSVEAVTIWKFERGEDASTWVSFDGAETCLCIVVTIHPTHR
jgi:hypothetical protein